MAKDLNRLATLQERHGDITGAEIYLRQEAASPPPPTQDDRVTALAIVNKHEKETETPIGYWASEELIEAICSALSSARVAGMEMQTDYTRGRIEAARVAERERIREAVEKMRDRWSASDVMKAEFGMFREALLNHVLKVVSQ